MSNPFSRLFRAKAASPPETVGLNDLLTWLGVDKVRGGKALSEATYFACIKVLSESLGKLPLKIQQATATSGIRVVYEHPYYRMLNERPNRFMSASTFWSMMEICRNHFGNAYAYIDTRDPQHPWLWPLDPRCVQVLYDSACAIKDVPDVYYYWSTPGGVAVLGSEEVLHFKAHLTLDGIVGIPVREQLASTVQSGIKAQNLLERMYENGMTAKSVLQYTGSINDKNVDTLVKQVVAYSKRRIKGDEANVIPLPQGFSLTPLNLKLTDAQFQESKQYTALQVAAAFGVKPNQIGDYSKSSYASAEAQQLAFLVDTLLYIVKSYEEEIGYKLLSDMEEKAGYHAKFNTGVMLRADQKTQIDTLSAAVSNFLMTPNEARERLDLPAKEGGDRLLGNGASIPVQYTGAQYTQSAPGKE